MNATVTWHGHSNFQIDCADITILIDPFFTGNPMADCAWDVVSRVDLLLITHMHGDHIGDAAALVQKHHCPVCTVVGTAEYLQKHGIDERYILGGGFNIGGTIVSHGMSITMTEAFHTSDAACPIGYIIRLPNGFTIYHSGDTGIFRNMKTWGELYSIDLALLPVGGFYTMDQRQAALAAAYLGAKAVIPMHWGTFPALAPRPDAMANHLQTYAPNCALHCMRPGERLTF